MGDSFTAYKKKRSMTSCKKVSFEDNLSLEKPERQLTVNYTQMIVSTYYSTSLRELCLLSRRNKFEFIEEQYLFNQINY